MRDRQTDGRTDRSTNQPVINLGDNSAFPFFCHQWGAKAFRNMQIIPPGSGIVHQVNLEYLARVVFAAGAGDAALLFSRVFVFVC